MDKYILADGVGIYGVCEDHRGSIKKVDKQTILGLTFTALWANSADDKLVIFSFFFFSHKIGFDFLCKFSPKETI